MTVAASFSEFCALVAQYVARQFGVLQAPATPGGEAPKGPDTADSLLAQLEAEAVRDAGLAYRRWMLLRRIRRLQATASAAIHRRGVTGYPG